MHKDHAVLRLLLCSCLAACAKSAATGEVEEITRDANDAVKDLGFEDASVPEDAPPPHDAGTPLAVDQDPPSAPTSRVDAGSVSLPEDKDAGGKVPDAPDASLPPPVRVPPKIDGVVNDGEWTYGVRVTQSEPTNWGVSKNELRDLYVVVDNDTLYMAVTGTIEAKNAIVVYLDVRENAGNAPANLSDNSGSLDAAISAQLTVASTHAVEFAWGTRAMGRWASGLDDLTGWRNLSVPSDFAWIDATNTAPTVCSLSACETRISLKDLAPSASALKVFARVVTATGDDVSNQTLPFDAPAAPRKVGNVLEVALPTGASTQ